MSIAFSLATQGQCSWPMSGSGGEMLVCGEPRGSHKSYCDKHAIAAGGSKRRLAQANTAALSAAALKPLVIPTSEQHQRLATLPLAKGGDVRRVAAIDLPANIKPNRVLSAPPEVRLVAPTDLLIEAAYQRDLSGKSIRLIRKIVDHWDWTKFKPPICAETDEGLVVIDGQHTAIAAATHTDIKQIPVMVGNADLLEKRAGAFVSHNRDRLLMSPFQIFHAEVASANTEATAVFRVVVECGAEIPRSPALKGYAKPGQLVSVNEVRAIYHGHGAETLRRVIGIAVKAGLAPIGVTITRALRMILTEPRFASVARLTDAELVAAIKQVGDIEAVSVIYARESGQGRHRACAVLIANAAGVKLVEEAA